MQAVLITQNGPDGSCLSGITMTILPETGLQGRTDAVVVYFVLSISLRGASIVRYPYTTAQKQRWCCQPRQACTELPYPT